MSFSVDDLRESGVWEDAEFAGGVFCEESDMGAHFLGAGCAVEADDVDFGECLDGDEGAGDIGTHEHCACGFHGDLADERGSGTGFVECFSAGVYCGFCLEDVLAGFDEEYVDAAVEESSGLFVVAFEECVVVDLA